MSTVLEPPRAKDVAFVSVERWPIDRPFPRVGDWQVIPDLAVEVVSPHAVSADVMAKMEEYFRVGVRQVWLVYPDQRQIYVYDGMEAVRVVGVDKMLETSLLPGYSAPVARLFPAAV
jgi:Uma2 family endonuclease